MCVLRAQSDAAMRRITVNATATVTCSSAVWYDYSTFQHIKPQDIPWCYMLVLLIFLQLQNNVEGVDLFTFCHLLLSILRLCFCFMVSLANQKYEIVFHVWYVDLGFHETYNTSKPRGLEVLKSHEILVYMFPVLTSGEHWQLIPMYRLNNSSNCHSWV